MLRGVSSTAMLAIYWKNEARKKERWDAICIEKGDRKVDLFKDELMAYFCNGDIKQAAETRLDKRMWLPLATRTRFFRRTLSHYVKCPSSSIKQVILLGGGCDTLPARKADYPVRFIEIDKAEVLEVKQRVYQEHGIEPNTTFIPLDYIKQNLLGALEVNQIDFTLPTFILFEGNSFYLNKSDVLNLFNLLADAFPNLILSFDFMHDEMATQTKNLDSQAQEHSLQQTLSSFKKNNAAFKTFFTPIEIAQQCEELGFEIAEQATATELARAYHVDQNPYYTAAIYSVITVVKGNITPHSTLSIDPPLEPQFSIMLRS